MKDEKYNIEELSSVTDTLVSENGCPWDRVQTHKSLTRYMLEEGYEAIDAADNDDIENLCEELGDVLFQVMIHSAIAKKNNEFTFEDVVDRITRKMIYRHPNIFKETDNMSWDELKKAEKGYTDNIDIIKNIPKALPALIKADKVISKSCKYNLDSISPAQSCDRIIKAAEEIKEHKFSHNDDYMELIGNILIDLSKISCFLQINAEFSLTNALKTYINNLEDFD